MKKNVILYVEKVLSKSETFIYNHILFLSKHYNLLILADEIFPGTINSDFQSIQIKNSIKRNSFTRIYKNRFIYLGFASKRRVQELNGVISSFKPDFIHCHFGIQALKLILNLPSIKIPIFITFHGYDVTLVTKSNPAYVRVLRKIFKSENIYPIFVCKFHKNYLESISISSQNSKIIYNGVDIKQFKRIESFPSEKSFIITQIGRLTVKKGHSKFLEALSILAKDNPSISLSYNIIGDGPLRKDIQKKIKLLNLEKFVTFWGWLAADEIIKILEKSHLLAHPSIIAGNNDMEGIPMVIFEAMSLEIPIFSTFHAGIPELVEHGINGYLAEECDISSYCKYLLKTRDMKNLQINRKKIASQFSLQIHNKALQTFYQEALNK